MKMIIPLIMAMMSMGLLACASVQSERDYIAFEQVKSNPAAFDGKRIFVEGFIVADVLSQIALYANADDAANNRMFLDIDLVPANSSIRKEVMYKLPTCVIAVGTFHTYKKNEIRTGTLVSDIGELDIEDVIQCKK